MALFRYEAFSKDGKKIRGTLDAPTVQAVRDHLTKSGLYPSSITSAQEARPTFFGTIKKLLERPVSIKDKILFTKQLAILLKSGVPLLQALELLTEQFSGKLKSIVIDLKDEIKEGQSLAYGLGKYPKVFENIYVQLVRAGEATGKLETILFRLVDYLERRQEITKKVTSALRYPLIQLAIVAFVVIALLTFVLPNLTQAFATEALPTSTRLLMNVSYVLIHYWYLLLIGIMILYGIFSYWRSTESGGYAYDTIKLKLPIIGFFSRMGAIVQFSRTLGMLVESGVNLSEALDIVVNIIDNRILADALNKAREKIIKQGRIADFLKQTGIFPPIAIYLINTGEQSGQLDTMLLTVAQNYEAELTEYSDNLSSLLEPIMIIVMGVVVGFVVLSVIQPIMQRSQGLNI